MDDVTNDERDRRRPQPDRRPSGDASGAGQRRGYVPSGAPDDSIDVREVHVDDAFLDALSRDLSTPTRDPAEYELAVLLSGWRHDVIGTPEPPLPALDEVARAMAAEMPTRRAAGVVRSLRIVAGAAAIAVVAAAGLTVVSEGAQPGDPLWGVKKVVFAQAASETQAAYDVRSDLEQAEAALAAGDTAQAQQLIERAQSKMGPVSDSGTREQMTQWINRLRSDESSRPSTSTTRSGSASVEPAPPADDTDATTAPETSEPTNQTTVPSVPPTSQVPPTSAEVPVPTSGGVPSTTAAASTVLSPS
ncbi:anti-sigma-D factor RsdA [Gordonia sp. VNK1]|uniref:anti-sigma-D factor RsdA n=1 Tax=Gordonia oleivorans TaxID=3156618 RepID=UPI0032B511C8